MKHVFRHIAWAAVLVGLVVWFAGSTSKPRPSASAATRLQRVVVLAELVVQGNRIEYHRSGLPLLSGW